MVELSNIDSLFLVVVDFIGWLRDLFISILPDFAVLVKIALAIGIAYAIDKYVKSPSVNIVIDAILIYLLLLTI